MSEAIAPWHDKTEWLKARKKGIGGSDAAAIIGANPYKTALDVWKEKTSEGVGEQEITPAMKRGIVLEPVAADLYVEETGRKVRRQPLRQHPEYEWMLGNVDRQILAGTADVEQTSILEIKCPGLRVMSNVKRHGLPDYMTVQLMHYLGVLGYEWGSFALFSAENWELICFDLERDQEFIDQLIEAERDFWLNHVLTGKPPETDADQSPVQVPKVEGELTVMDDEEWREAARELAEARELKDTAKELEKAAKEEFKELMHREEVHAVEVPGIMRAYFKPYPGRTSWKKTAQAIANDLNVNLENYIVKGSSYERFTPYPLNGE